LVCAVHDASRSSGIFREDRLFLALLHYKTVGWVWCEIGLALRFSPDNSRLRFTLNKSDLGYSSIWEVRTDDRGLHPLLPGWHVPDSECCGVWSADGRYYFFISVTSGLSNIWVLREPRGPFRQQASVPFQLTTGPMSLTFLLPSGLVSRRQAPGLWSSSVHTGNDRQNCH